MLCITGDWLHHQVPRGEWFTVNYSLFSHVHCDVNLQLVFTHAGFVYWSILSLIRLTCAHAHINWSSFCILSFYFWDVWHYSERIIRIEILFTESTSTKTKTCSADIKTQLVLENKWCIRQLEVMWKIISMAVKKNHHSLGQAYMETQTLDPLYGRHRNTRRSQECQKMKPLLSTKTVIHSRVLFHFTWVIQLLVGETCVTYSTWIFAKGTSSSPPLPDVIVPVMFLFLVVAL